MSESIAEPTPAQNCTMVLATLALHVAAWTSLGEFLRSGSGPEHPRWVRGRYAERLALPCAGLCPPQPVRRT